MLDQLVIPTIIMASEITASLMSGWIPTGRQLPGWHAGIHLGKYCANYCSLGMAEFAFYFMISSSMTKVE